jgi:alcohol-forming fatty acyl-CoA reductase
MNRVENEFSDRHSVMSRAVYCDVDGTLADTDIAKPLIWIKGRHLRGPAQWWWYSSLLARGPWWLLLDKISRTASNRSIYKNYKGMPADQTRALAAFYFREHFRARLFPEALRSLDQFGKEGLKIVLVTGALDFFMEPLAQEFGGECIAARLEERNGVFTGKLLSLPMTGPRKSEAIRAHARAHGIDLKNSYALGDAISDLPMLELVGNPVAVNPDSRLESVAAKRGWKRERWRH